MEENNMVEKDMVNHPDHYQVNDLECIDEMVVMFGVEKVIAHCECTAWKYRYRAGNKWDKEEDLKKANWYIKKALELEADKDGALKCVYNKYISQEPLK